MGGLPGGCIRATLTLVLLAAGVGFGPPPAAAQAAAGIPATFRWGPQRPDLVRYNRVEGLSLGARGQLLPSTPAGPVSLTATARMGTGHRVPSGRLELTREGLDRRLTLALYQEVAAMGEDVRPLGPGNSLTALLLGRDDGEYLRRAGATLAWTPPSAERRSFRVRGWAERHHALPASSPPALRHLGEDGWRFRPNLQAAGGWDVGAGVELAPWWGTDPRTPQAGLAAALQAGAGSWSYRIVDLTGTVLLPLSGSLRAGAELQGATGWGEVPPQRSFRVGGAATLRGYEPLAATGSSLLRLRAEVGRVAPFGVLLLFGDGAWAGEREDFRAGDLLWSAGVGASLVDGLLRADAAWGLSGGRRFRLELYLDGLL